MTNIYNLMAILAFRFIPAAFSAHFLRTEDKQVLLSLFSEAPSSGVDSKVVDSKVAHSKYAGSGKAGSEKVSRFSVDFILFLLLLSPKSCKECFGTYFLKSH